MGTYLFKSFGGATTATTEKSPTNEKPEKAAPATTIMADGGKAAKTKKAALKLCGVKTTMEAAKELKDKHQNAIIKESKGKYFVFKPATK